MEKLCVVYVTASSKVEAAKIGEKLVSERLAACANIFDNVSSFYWWENKVQHDQEAILIVKTRESHFSELQSVVKEMHTYSCPCIVAFPIVDADPDYAKWIIRETDKKKNDN